MAQGIVLQSRKEEVYIIWITPTFPFESLSQMSLSTILLLFHYSICYSVKVWEMSMCVPHILIPRYVSMCLCANVSMCQCVYVPMCQCIVLLTFCLLCVNSQVPMWRHLQQYGTSYVTYNSMVLLTSLTTVWYFIRNFLHTVCKQLSPYVTSLTTVWYFIRNFLHTVCKQLSPYVTSLTTVWYFLRNFLHTVC